jgi:PadR family transcriptional regulator, regulatory protein PadR
MLSPPLREPTYFILTALASGPAHGYRLLQLIDELSGGRVRLRAGTLYAALDRLERDGHITLESTGSDGGPPRRSFSLTPAGRDLLAGEVDRLQANAAVGRASLSHGLST